MVAKGTQRTLKKVEGCSHGYIAFLLWPGSLRRVLPLIKSSDFILFDVVRPMHPRCACAEVKAGLLRPVIKLDSQGNNMLTTVSPSAPSTSNTEQ